MPKNHRQMNCRAHGESHFYRSRSGEELRVASGTELCVCVPLSTSALALINPNISFHNRIRPRDLSVKWEERLVD